LLPALAYGQASTATGAQTATPAANLQARVSAPPAFNHGAPASASVASHPLKNFVTLHTDSMASNEAVLQNGAISYTLTTGGGNASTSPVLTHAVAVGLGYDQMVPNAANVSIHLTVDRQGIPTNLKVARSAGAALDNKTLAAVSQYRFKPATYDRLPVDADVTVDIKLQKQ